MKVNTQGEYGGIGIHIGMRDGVLTIIAPIEDTPGFRAGLQSGDRIMAVDGESTSRTSAGVGMWRIVRSSAAANTAVFLKTNSFNPY